MGKLLLLLFLVSSFIGNNLVFGECDYSNTNTKVSDCLNDYKPTTLVGTENTEDYTIEGEFKTQISTIVKNISIALSIIAVGSLVFAGLKMTLSMGKDEDIKKAKDIIKWTIIGYLALISAGAIIAIVINFIYGLG